jgi:predicted nucleotidyltransferase
MVNRKNAPDLGTVIRQIRSCRDQLKEKGVGHLFIFGSVARGDAMRESDIDIFIDPALPDCFTLVDLGRVTEFLQYTLAKPVDVLTSETLRQSRFAHHAYEEAVSVF